jgi:hypothetical protein
MRQQKLQLGLRVKGWTSWEAASDGVRNNIYRSTELGEEQFEALRANLDRPRSHVPKPRRDWLPSGNYHQKATFGVPIFSDGTVLMCSKMLWGGIMADI